ncbi:uncharacterized protein BX664DRAFT_286121 [Halteromyces radiatus]|uniref:uncharacterized protein n=1 Tax=Halteromyces radiatus TaxID=101107 RepID=UPI00221F237D|nr:uncharacterized protein BX664DRAFT_286121 [Halteromyces radiatus]KAI8079749.1 hypothetical protein BX664DRAFT_286121 [Halteromyces radiatus]
MDSSEQVSDLPPSAQLARLHAQAKSDSLVEEPIVPSRNDPVVVENSMFAEPLIAGDYPTPIGQPVKKPTNVTPNKKKQESNLDLSSESAFPTLSSGAPRPPVISSGWSSAASRVKARPVVQQQQQKKRTTGNNGTISSGASITDVLELPANQQIANQSNKPLGFKSAADVIQQVINRTGTNIIASTNRTGTTTFLIQGLTADVAKAKRELVAGLVVKRTVEIPVPASTRRFIIGTKGKTLQQIENLSGTRINIPPRKDDEIKDEENDDTVNITVVGDVAGIKIAKAEIEKIVGEKAAKQTLKIDQFDPRFHLFLAGPQNSTIKALEEELNVKIQMPPFVNVGEIKTGDQVNNAISITGDKEKLQLAKQALESHYAELQKSTRTAAIGVPKRQHKYLFGKDGATVKEILEQSGCTVELPPFNDPSENVTIRGPEQRLINGLTLVMEKARAVHVNALDLADLHKNATNPLQHGQHIITYLVHKDSLKAIENEHHVQVGIPRGQELTKSVSLEFVSKNETDATEAYRAGYDLCRSLVPEHITTVNIDSHLHRHIHLRHARQLQGIKSRHDVAVIFPEEKEDSSVILLVFENSKKDGESVSPQDALKAAATELQKIAADSSDIVSKSISIPSKFHPIINGPKGTTLNAILGGDETTVTVRFGGDKEDDVIVRGLNSEVKHAINEIQKVYEAAKHEEFVNSYTTEFTIPAAYSAHVIGKSGVNINKLKEDLGVKIDIGDNNKVNDGGFEAVKSKKKDQHVKVVIQGIKVNVEAAKVRVSALVATLADQVTSNLNVPKEFHRFLIGPNGRYVKKLEDKYSVFIKFPKGQHVNGDESPIPGGNPDTITIRGRKKDVAAAKDELTELYEYEKEELVKRKEREAKHRQAEEKRKAAAAATTTTTTETDETS